MNDHTKAKCQLAAACIVGSLKTAFGAVTGGALGLVGGLMVPLLPVTTPLAALVEASHGNWKGVRSDLITGGAALAFTAAICGIVHLSNTYDAFTNYLLVTASLGAGVGTLVGGALSYSPIAEGVKAVKDTRPAASNKGNTPAPQMV